VDRLLFADLLGIIEGLTYIFMSVRCLFDRIFHADRALNSRRQVLVRASMLIGEVAVLQEHDSIASHFLDNVLLKGQDDCQLGFASPFSAWQRPDLKANSCVKRLI
jgi:hypothetical protein